MSVVYVYVSVSQCMQTIDISGIIFGVLVMAGMLKKKKVNSGGWLVGKGVRSPTTTGNQPKTFDSIITVVVGDQGRLLTPHHLSGLIVRSSEYK